MPRDRVFPRLRKVIIVSGCFWHMHTCGRCRIPVTRREYWVAKLARNARRDRSNLRKLRQAGWQVLTIWECQTQLRQVDSLRDWIERFLRT